MIFYIFLIFSIFLVGGILFLIFYGVYAIMQEYRADRVPALLYHRFLSKEKVEKGEIIDHDRTYTCYDTAFAEQMAYLHGAGYTSISLDDFVAFLDGKQSLPPKPILITCDDGFMSNYLHAFPILKKYQMKATIFVTPDPASENFKKYASLDVPLTHEQLREMTNSGVSIESHGMTHRYLTELEPEVVRWELQESKRVLATITQKPVHFLAIPSGAYNKTVKNLAKEADYKAVFCMLKGSNNARSDRFALRRVVIARDFTLEDFQKVLEPATACHLRLTSFVQNLLLRLLGPQGLDALRDRLYRTRLASLLISGQLKSFGGGLAVVMGVMLSLIGAILLGWLL